MSNSPQESLKETISFLDKLLQGVIVNYLGFILVYLLFFEKSLKSTFHCIASISLLAVISFLFLRGLKSSGALGKFLFVDKIKLLLCYAWFMFMMIICYLLAMQEHFLPKAKESNKKLQIVKENSLDG